jgi:asparagine synthase (glutamine-hydrolysing)
MMHTPYVAVSWSRARPPAVDVLAELSDAFLACGWSLALTRPDLWLWQRGDRPLQVSASCGRVVIGRWFGDAAGVADGVHRPVAERARRLCRDGWGSYVALLQDGPGGPWSAFRDPSGVVEALTWRAGDCAIVASGFAGVPTHLQPGRLALDWLVIADFLRRPAAQFGRSGLHDVSPIAPGDLQRLGGAEDAAVPIWRPRDFLPAGAQVEPEWPEHLAATVQSVIERLLRPFERLASETSGGFDSSVVNAGLCRAGLGGRLAAAVHYVGERPEADERPWVDLLAARYDLPVARMALATGAIDPERDFADLARDVRPPYAAVDADRDRDTAALLERVGAQTLVTGKGGDALFFQMPSAAVLADLWAVGGWSAARHPRHAEVAAWTRRSVWSLWREALRRRPSGGPASALGALAGPRLGPAPPIPPHPWLAGLEDLPPGKRLQIEALVSSFTSVGVTRRGRIAQVVQPLLAQPVMELCLSIPTWELVRGGRDRGLAREAFADWLPEPLVQRRSKGNLTTHYARRTAASAEVLRAHVLDGVLVDAGLLDRRETEAALQPDSLIWRAEGSDLIGVAALESWVRYWQTRVADAPHARRPSLAD